MTPRAAVGGFTAILFSLTLSNSLRAEQQSQEILPTWIKPSLDFRQRYEFRDEEGLAPSHAATFRSRIGLLLGEIRGFSGFAELEDTRLLIDEFNAGAGARPVNPSKTTISDPENTELNQAWLQYKAEKISTKVGRQRIIRDDANMVGNVGWRQNEQTFDAITFEFVDKTTFLSYSLANRVQRIFGNDASPFGEEFEGGFHLLNGHTRLGHGSLGGYAYLVDIDDNGGAAANVGRSHTYGSYFKNESWHAEAAWQEGDSALVKGGNYDALFLRFAHYQKLGGAKLTVGTEYLGRHFKTPLATVHAFNGYADAFAGQRIGLNDLNGRFTGLTDFHVKATLPAIAFGIVPTPSLHWFVNDSLSQTYGYEADLVLSKKITERLSIAMKGAWFTADDGPAGFGDVRQVTLDLGASW